MLADIWECILSSSFYVTSAPIHVVSEWISAAKGYILFIKTEYCYTWVDRELSIQELKIFKWFFQSTICFRLIITENANSFFKRITNSRNQLYFGTDLLEKSITCKQYHTISLLGYIMQQNWRYVCDDFFVALSVMTQKSLE